MRRKPRPPKSDQRQPWQIEQGKRCGCRGTDDMCPCQNENPWPRPRRDLEGEIRTLELQQKTDRETIAAIVSRASRAEAALARAVEEITWQDVRLAAGEGPLTPTDVLAACNAELQRRAGHLHAKTEGA